MFRGEDEVVWNRMFREDGIAVPDAEIVSRGGTESATRSLSANAFLRPMCALAESRATALRRIECREKRVGRIKWLGCEAICICGYKFGVSVALERLGDVRLSWAVSVPVVMIAESK